MYRRGLEIVLGGNWINSASWWSILTESAFAEYCSRTLKVQGGSSMAPQITQWTEVCCNIKWEQDSSESYTRSALSGIVAINDRSL